MFPVETEYKDKLKGEAAEAVLSNADHKGVYVRISEWDEDQNADRTTKEGYSFRDYENGDPSKQFFISTQEVDHAQNYKHVVAEIERITGKTGLIIIVY